MSAVPTRYLMDANTFIEAKKRYYGFDVCPGYWKAVLAHHGAGTLCSIDRVRDEMTGEGDDLSNWVANDVPGGFFNPSNDAAILAVYGGLVAWVQGQAQFMQAAKVEFANVADGWLIAYAKHHGFTLVTEEILQPESKRRVPIPNVCQQFGVPFINTFKMLADLNVRFEWNGMVAAAVAAAQLAPAANGVQ